MKIENGGVDFSASLMKIFFPQVIQFYTPNGAVVIDRKIQKT